MGSKKLIALIVVSALLAFTLPACVFSSSNEPSKSTELKTLVIGTDPYPPFVSDDADGNASGIDVDILTEALGRIGYKPEFKYIAWQKKNELLATGELDCIAGCFSMTGREADYHWAGPYMKSRQVVAVEPRLPILRVKALPCNPLPSRRASCLTTRTPTCRRW